MKNAEAVIQIALASHFHVFCFQSEGVVKSLMTGGGRDGGGGLKNFRTGGYQFGGEGIFAGGGQYSITCHGSTDFIRNISRNLLRDCLQISLLLLSESINFYSP